MWLLFLCLLPLRLHSRRWRRVKLRPSFTLDPLQGLVQKVGLFRRPHNFIVAPQKSLEDLQLLVGVELGDVDGSVAKLLPERPQRGGTESNLGLVLRAEVRIRVRLGPEILDALGSRFHRRTSNRRKILNRTEIFEVQVDLRFFLPVELVGIGITSGTRPVVRERRRPRLADGLRSG